MHPMSKEARTGAGTWEREASTLALRVSDSLRELLGGAPTSLEELLSFVHPEDRDNVERGWRRATSVSSRSIIVWFARTRRRVGGGPQLGACEGCVGTRAADGGHGPHASSHRVGWRAGWCGRVGSVGEQADAADLIANLPGFVYRCANDRDWTMYYLGGRFRGGDWIRSGGGAAEPRVAVQRHDPGRASGVLVEDVAGSGWRSASRSWRSTRSGRRTGAYKWVWEQGRGVFDEKGNCSASKGSSRTSRRASRRSRRWRSAPRS